MGTDMHVLVEIGLDDQPWRPLRNMATAWKAAREYPLFAFLGDVRNHAGRHEPIWQEPRTVTDDEGTEHNIPGWWYAPDDGGHDRLVPISEPRGVPDDATLTWKAYVAIWESRKPSMDVTWLTIEEIQGGDWDQVVYSYGVLMEEDYLKLINEGITPTQHPLAAGGPGVAVVSEEEYAAGERGEVTTCINARWVSGPLRECFPEFYEMVQGLADGKPEAARLRFMLLFES